MMRWVRIVHAWAGAALGLVLFAVCLSGSALVAEPLLRRATLPPTPGYVLPDAATLAAQAQSIVSANTGRVIAALEAPESGFGYWRVYFDDGGGAYYTAGLTEAAYAWARPSGDALAWIYELHAHLLAGEAGEMLNGWLGALLVLFAFTGLWLWAKARGKRAYRLVPASFTRVDLVRWHRDAGALGAGLIALAGATGFAMVFEGELRKALEGNGPPAPAPAIAQVSPGWGPALADIARAYPQSQLRLVMMPLDLADPVGFRFRQQGEWHPNGRTDFWVNLRTGEIVSFRDGLKMSPTRRALAAMFPLHAGVSGQVWWSIVIAFAGLAACGLIAAGVAGFVMRQAALLRTKQGA
jgi:uncharacterized iron-regulated membrane protein